MEDNLPPAADAPLGYELAGAAEPTLDPGDWAGLAALGHRMVDDMFEWLATVRERPAWQPVPESTRAALERPLPEHGVGPAVAYEEFLRHVRPYPLGNVHPRFWGWVIGSGNPVGALAEFLAASFNPNVSGLGSAAIPVEDQVLAWLRELLGYPASAGGLLTSGGSMANVLGIAVGVHAMAGFDYVDDGLAAAPRRMTFYGSVETHSSVDKAARMLGLGRSAWRRIAVDADHAVDVDAMRRRIHEDRDAGCHPFLVVGNAGTVSTGAFDDLVRLADLAAEEDLWLHVDGAFGVFAAAVPSLRHLTAGLERAHSVAFDLHKWMHTPIEAACVLVRDPEAQKRAFAAEGAYLAPLARGPGHDGTRFADRGPQLTRGFRALKIWMELEAHGAGVYRELVARNVAQARELAELVAAEPSLELLAPVPLNIVCFRHRAAGFDAAALDELNRELLMRLQERGIAVPSHTVLDGRFALRVCITNHRTRSSDLALLVEAVRGIGSELLAERRGEPGVA